jgi:hypothetical protein
MGSPPRTVCDFSEAGSGCFACFVSGDSTALETDAHAHMPTPPDQGSGKQPGKLECARDDGVINSISAEKAVRNGQTVNDALVCFVASTVNKID